VNRGTSPLDRLGDGVLAALAVVFALVAVIFLLGLIWAIVNGEPLVLVTQAVMAGAFGALDLRLWRILRERRARRA
jgi:hypothetical protein